MELKFDDKQFKKVMAELLFAQLTEEHREEIFTKAIEAFFKRDSHGGRISSQMDRVFEKAMRDLAAETVKKYFNESEEFVSNLHGLCEEAVKNAFKGEMRNRIVEAVQTAVVKVITGGR